MPKKPINLHLSSTGLLDFEQENVASLLRDRGWSSLSVHDRIGAAYDFVRNEILFGYNRTDDRSASAVLRDGFGQCNTKATLLMALLRVLNVPCRLHGFTIHKSLQRGIVPELVYPFAPENILHSWVEVQYEGRWINLEGFILDEPFLNTLQRTFAKKSEQLCSYGAGTDCLSNPDIEWAGLDTYVQKTGINGDLGVFDNPDGFYAKHRQAFGFLKSVLYQHIIRLWMNARVKRIRAGNVPIIPTIDSDTTIYANPSITRANAKNSGEF